MAILILSTIMFVTFMVLIIRQRHPLIKKYVNIAISKSAHIDSGVFLLKDKSANVTLVFIKNLGCRLSVGGVSVNFPFSKFTTYKIYPNKLCLWGDDVTMLVTKNGIKFYLKNVKDFSYDFAKPQFAYCFDRSGQVSFCDSKHKFALKFVGFDDLDISTIDKGKLRISGKIWKEARLEFCFGLRVADKLDVREYKQRNFGVIDVSVWDFVPKFRAGKLSPLQKRNLEEKFALSSRKIELPKVIEINEIKWTKRLKIDCPSYFNLGKLGLSRVVEVNKRGLNADIRDLLTRVRYKISANAHFECRVVCHFGIDYLCVDSFDGAIELKLTPYFRGCSTVCDHKISTLCGMYKDNDLVDFSSVISRLNLLILHGFWVDVEAVILEINYRFLSPYTQFLLANMLLSFITTFGKTALLAKLKFRNLIVRGLCYAMETETSESACFCDKILPLIKSERAHQRVFLHKLKCSSVVKNSWECILSQKLGIVLRGNELTIQPQKNLKIETSVVICGKKINLDISPNWIVVKINNLTLSNIYAFDITKLGDNTSLSFD